MRVSLPPLPTTKVMGYGLWVMGYGLWVMGYGLWVMVDGGPCTIPGGRCLLGVFLPGALPESVDDRTRRGCYSSGLRLLRFLVPTRTQTLPWVGFVLPAPSASGPPCKGWCGDLGMGDTKRSLFIVHLPRPLTGTLGKVLTVCALSPVCSAPPQLTQHRSGLRSVPEKEAVLESDGTCLIRYLKGA